MSNNIWYNYLDYTLEEASRIFYVGKGNDIRIKTDKRNIIWKRIANKYGWRREIIMSTKYEIYALEMEKIFISKYKTFAADWKDGSGWGANLTRGGEGTSGVKYSDEWKQHQSKIRKGIPKSESHKQNMSASRIGKYTGKDNPMFGTRRSDEWKQKASMAKIGLCAGENNPKVLLKEIDVLIIRDEWSLGKIARKKLAEKYNVSEGCIESIIYNQSWKIPEKEFIKLKEIRAKNLLEQSLNYISADDATIIRNKWSSGNYTQKQLANEYNVSKGCISHIICNRVKKISLEKYSALQEERNINIILKSSLKNKKVK